MKAGIHKLLTLLDSRLRGSDKLEIIRGYLKTEKGYRSTFSPTPPCPVFASWIFSQLLKGYSYSYKWVEFCSKFFYIGKMVNSEEIKNVILCHPKDNVATAKSPIKRGTLLTLPKGKKVMVKEEIPFGHKVALRRISAKGPE